MTKFAAKILRIHLILGVAFLLHTPLAQAQIATASVNGTVRDTSGGVIPGTTVLLHNIATGVDRTTVTNNTGRYVLLNAPPGQYILHVSKDGFKTQVSSITLVVDQTATLDFALPVGATTQTVSVSATAPRLQASTAELGTAITNDPVVALPLNGRNFTQLLTLTPGASPANVAQNAGGYFTPPIGSFSFPAVNGQNNRSIYFYVDGLSDQEPDTSMYAVAPILESIQEFKVDSHNDQANFGGVLGGFINVVTMSGTNHLHGSLWEFVRNPSLNARNPFLTTRNPLKQNQFGAVIGGPVILPHYNGKDKTFFYAGFESVRRVEAAQALGFVPTAQEYNGDFSDISIPIYNPFSTRPDPNNAGQFIRDQFTGNIIPTSLINTGSVAYMKLTYPAPNSTGIAGVNAVDNSPVRRQNDEYNLRGDHVFGPRDSVFARFTHNELQVFTKSLTNELTTADLPSYNLATGWTHTFGPSAVLQLHFGRTRWEYDNTTRYINAPANFDQQVGFLNGFVCGYAFGATCLIPGETSTYVIPTDLYEWKGDFSKTHGRHLLSMGLDVNMENLPNDVTESASVGFNNIQTGNPEGQQATGYTYASEVIGVPDNAYRQNVNGATEGGKVLGSYFQDQWHISDKLTVNLGIRWDETLMPRIRSPYNFVGDYDLKRGVYILEALPPSCAATSGQAPCIPGGTLPSNVVVSPDGRLMYSQNTNFQPRLGFAYRLFPRTALRASYGRFFDNWSGITQSTQNDRGQWPSLGILRMNSQNYPTPAAPTPTTTMESPGIQGIGMPAATPFGNVAFFRDPHMKNALSDQWMFGIQHQLTANTVLEADYVGSHSGQLDVGGVKNTAVTPGPGTPSARYPFPYITPTNYDESIGRSDYDALQVKLNAHTNHGLTYLVSYTYSKSMSIGCDGYIGVEGCFIENQYNLNANRSVSGFDLTHMLSASGVWELPVGPGKRFSSSNKFVDGVVGNWRMGAIMTMTSGLPFTVLTTGDPANIGATGYDRPNLVGNPKLSNPSVGKWFNTSAFQSPAVFTFGNVGRNTMRGNWFKNLDFSIHRQFPLPINETTRLEFRAEMFNSTNTPTWGNPDNTISDKNFGIVTSTRSTERQIQLALKLYF